MSHEMAEGRTYQYRGASKAAIQHHYDVGNGFYERFLGPTLAYSAGLWNEPANRDTLDDAQNRKLDWHIDRSGADRARRVLDVGCGWGSLIKRLAVRNPQAVVTGITMSDAQIEYLRKTAGDRVRIAASSWQDFHSDERYNSIVGIEVIEHCATNDLSVEQRRQALRDFFDFCAQHLVSDGRVSLQVANWYNVDPGEEKQYASISDFFPEFFLPRIPDVVAAAEGLFHVTRIETAPHDFIYTLREWLRRLRANEAELRREFGDKKVADFIDYFSLFIGGFMSGAIAVSRMAFERRTPMRPGQLRSVK